MSSFLQLLVCLLFLSSSFVGDSVEPEEIARLLSASNRPRPSIIYVGFPSLYNGAHLTGAILAGPTSKPDGIEQLKQVVRNMPHSHPVVIYCGCCPFDKCPNIHPAYNVLQDLGFSNVKVVVIKTNLHTDWVSKGYPTTKGPMPVAAADVKR
ncbi:MAG: rhodanese-like domain-containing protein [Bryobacteraceae bacterium]